MQSFDGRPTEWSEEERINLALHIFHQRERRTGARPSAAQVLFEHLAQYQPDWDDLPLPGGRTVAQARAVFGTYSQLIPGPNTAYSMGPSPASYNYPSAGTSTGAVIPRKRSAPSDTLTPNLGRPLAPKQPSAFGPEPIARASITGYQQPVSPMVEPPPRLDEPRKKRGRPTKQEAEDRRRKMEARQQMRQAQIQAQSGQSSQSVQSAGAFASHYGPPAQPLPAGLIPQMPREDTPASSSVPPPPTIAQTPRGQSLDEPSSSGSSGKKRRARPPRPAVSETELPPPPFYPMPPNPPGPVHGSPPQSSSQLGGRSPFLAQSSTTFATSIPPSQSDVPPYDADEEHRPENPRSRPWEVRDRPGMS